MKKIISVLILISMALLTGCKQVTFEYDLFVNTENPLKSMFFFDSKADSDFFAYLTIKGESALYKINFDLATSGDTKLNHAKIEESSDFTLNRLEIVELWRAGRVFALGLFDGESYELHLSMGFLNNTYKNHSGVSKTIIIKSPLNRLKVVELSSELTQPSGHLSLPLYESHVLLDYKLFNDDHAPYSLRMLTINEQALYSLVVTKTNTGYAVDEVLIDIDVIDAYYENDFNNVVYLKNNSLNYLSLNDGTSKTLELIEPVKNFYPVKAYYEESTLRYHVIETTNHISIYDSDLVLLYDIEKKPNITYVGINHYVTELEAYIQYYYLDEGILKRDYKNFAFLR